MKLIIEGKKEDVEYIHRRLQYFEEVHSKKVNITIE